MEELIPNLYDTHIKENFHIFGIATLLYACLYTFCMYKNDAGITYPLLILGTFGYMHFVMKNLKMKWKKESLFYVISMVLLSISTFCTDDFRIIFLNKTAVFFLGLCMALGIVYDTKKWDFIKFIKSIFQTIFLSIGELGRPFQDIKWFCTHKLNSKNSKYLYGIIGIGITIPIVAIVFSLLSSADIVFRNWGNQLTSGLKWDDFWGIGMMYGFVFLSSYCLMTYLSKKQLKEEVEDLRKWNPLLAIPVVTVLSFLYLVFSGIQIRYLFIGNMQLPDGYTYAQYAREGFFQLLGVSMINLLIVLVGLYLFEKSKILKTVLTIMSLCTFIMIASSAMRMIIYIQYYYLTFLRIFVLWSLLVLFLLFLGIVAFIVKSGFPLFRYSMVVVTVLYVVFSFSHPDYWVAKVNLDSTKETRSEFFKGEAYDDFYLLELLSADAAPVLVEWMKEEGLSMEAYLDEEMSYQVYHRVCTYEDDKNLSEDKIQCAYYYLSRLGRNCSSLSIREYNIARVVADKAIEK